MISRALEHLDIKMLLFAAAVFQLWDGIITHVFVRNGRVQEGNPLMAPLVNDGSFLPVKITGILISILLLYILYRRFPRIAISAASCVVLLYAGVLTWNYAVLFHIA